MSYKDATAYAASLAATLMVSIVVFQAGDGTHAAMRRAHRTWPVSEGCLARESIQRRTHIGITSISKATKMSIPTVMYAIALLGQRKTRL